MSRDLPADVRLAYSRIQQVVKTAVSPGAMRRDLVQAEKREVENALVVLDIYSRERGYREGFAAGVRSAAERGRGESETSEEALKSLLHATLEESEVRLADILSEMPAHEVDSIGIAAAEAHARHANISDR
jgi:hypothetical protein